MATTGTDVHEAAAKTTLVDRLTDAARHGSHLAHQAHLAKSLVQDAVEDGLHAATRARKAAQRRVEQLEDYKEDAIHYIKRRPLTAVAVATASGLLFGLLCGWIVGQRRLSAYEDPARDR